MLKILAVGNSFSQDATRYVERAAAGAGNPLLVRNLYIGGCSLKRHWEEHLSGARDYEIEQDAEPICRVSLGEALRMREWDYITFQQVSGLSGEIASFEPWLGNLLTLARELAPSARFVLHRTWAYEPGSEHGDFPRYGCDTDAMDRSIGEAYAFYAKKYGLGVIPAGETVAKLRRSGILDGRPVTRDGYHLSYDYGRYAAALAWLRFFTGSARTEYMPGELDGSILGAIQKLAQEL